MSLTGKVTLVGLYSCSCAHMRSYPYTSDMRRLDAYRQSVNKIRRDILHRKQEILCSTKQFDTEKLLLKMRLTDNFFIVEMAAVWRDKELILDIILAIDDRDTVAFVLLYGLVNT